VRGIVEASVAGESEYGDVEAGAGERGWEGWVVPGGVGEVGILRDAAVQCGKKPWCDEEHGDGWFVGGSYDGFIVY